jgi:hypothetical protein
MANPNSLDTRDTLPTTRRQTGFANASQLRLGPVMRVILRTMKNPLKNKFVLIFICVFILVSSVAALTGGSAFIQEHSLAILIVFLLTILILDFLT